MQNQKTWFGVDLLSNVLLHSFKGAANNYHKVRSCKSYPNPQLGYGGKHANYNKSRFLRFFLLAFILRLGTCLGWRWNEEGA